MTHRMLAVTLALTAVVQPVRGAAALVPQQDVVAITRATVIDGTGRAPIPNATVVIRRDRITAVGAADAVPIPAGARVIDAAGLTLVPGLIDAHVHYGMGAMLPGGASSELTLDSLAAFSRFGVTSILDLGDAYPWIIEAKRAVEGGRVAGPRIFAAGPTFTAPGGHPAGSWLKDHPDAIAAGTRQVTDPAAARRSVDSLVAGGVDVIKVIVDGGSTRSPFGLLPKLDSAVLRAVVEQAKARGLPSIVHWGRVGDLPGILAVRPAAITHVAIGPMPDSLIRQLADLRVLVSPTLVAIAQFLPPDLYRQLVAANVKKMHEAGVTLVVGTDAPIGSKFGDAVHRELELLVEAGVPPMAALQAATRNAAMFMGRGRDLGTIEVGKLADLVALAGNPLESISATRQVRLTIAGGRVVDAR